MNAAILLAGVAVLAIVAARGKWLLTLGALAVTILLVPGTILLPHAPSGLVTIPRVIEAAAVLGLLVARRREGPPVDRLPMPPVLFVLLGYLLVAALTGLALADPLTSPVPAAYVWVGQAEQAIILVIALLLGRRLPARPVLWVLVGVGAVAAFVGLLEAATGGSYARLFFHAVPSQLSSTPAQVLETRAGHLRVRGAADFALAYGWMLTALVPVAVAGVVVAARNGRRVWPAIAAAVVAALGVTAYLTRTRSSLLALMVVVVILGILLLPRRGAAFVAAGLAVAVAALVFGPDVVSTLSPSVNQGSIDVRLQRLPLVLGLAAQRPLRGIGLTGITRLGIAGFDSSYVRIYVEMGAIAVTLIVASLGTAIVGALRGGWHRAVRLVDDDDALLALGAGLGVALMAMSAVSYDTLSVLGSSRLLWLLCGLGIAASERLRGPQLLPHWRRILSVRRIAVVLVAVCVGVLLNVWAPRTAADTAIFATLNVRTEVDDDPPGMGTTLVTTTCQAAVEIAQVGHSWRVTSCGAAGPPGWGRVRVEADDKKTAARALSQVAVAAHDVPGMRAFRIAPQAGGAQSGIPAAARTAPEVLGLAALVGVCIVPARRRRSVAS